MVLVLVLGACLFPHSHIRAFEHSSIREFPSSPSRLPIDISQSNASSEKRLFDMFFGDFEDF
jgi:hypothetical protein